MMAGLTLDQDQSPSSLTRRATLALPLAALVLAMPGDTARADAAMDKRIADLTPALESYIAKGIAMFDNPGLAIGIVTGDKLVYAKGFGTRKKGGEPVDTQTVFQIGSTTKAFLATTMAIAADQKKLGWNDRIVDLHPDFQMMDPWVTSEFRVSDLLAQHSGLPPYANDMVGMLGFDQEALVRTLRYVEPVSSFRSTFAYTNITHILAQHIVARQMGAADWDSVVRAEIFEPLGMSSTSLTADAIEAAPNHAEGHRWEPAGTVEVPFTPIFPYNFGGAGAINSSIEDVSRWVRLHLASGMFEGKRIVSAENLAVTKTPRTPLNDKIAYAMGWLVQITPNGRIVWHNGGTAAFGAFIGTAPDKDVGVIVLTNETNMGLPDAIGEWTFDRLMGNPEFDHVAARFKAAADGAKANEKAFVKPASPRPSSPLASFAGNYIQTSIGMSTVSVDGAALVLAVDGTGAKLRLDHWDGDVFTATLLPEGRFAPLVADLGPDPIGFVQFEIDKDAALNRFRLVMQSDGQSYDFVPK